MCVVGADCEASPCMERPLKALLKEASRNENVLKGLLSHSERLTFGVSRLPLILGGRIVGGQSWGLNGNGVLPFLFPKIRAVPGSSSCASNEVAGRFSEDVGLCDLGYDMAD